MAILPLQRDERNALYKVKRMHLWYLPPANERADLSLILRLMGPPMLGAGECRIGDLTADANVPIETAGCGTAELIDGILVETDVGLSFKESGVPNCLERWR